MVPFFNNLMALPGKHPSYHASNKRKRWLILALLAGIAYLLPQDRGPSIVKTKPSAPTRVVSGDRNGKYSATFRKPVLGDPDPVYFWGDFLGIRGNRNIYTYWGFLDDDGKATSKEQIDDVDNDPLKKGWDGAGIYGGASPIQGFVCPKPPTERDLDKEPVLIYDLAHGGGPDNLSDEDKDNQASCPVPWKFTDHPWKSDVIRYDVFAGGRVPVIRPAKRKCGHHKFAFSSLESAGYYPQVVEQPFATGLDATMDYRLDSTVPANYILKGWNFRTPPPKAEIAEKQEVYATSWISNCGPLNARNEVLTAIGKIVPIHNYGRCQNNAKLDPALQSKHPWDQKIITMSRYPFTLVFENSNTRDYVTEKLWQALLANTLPIYMGDPWIRETGNLPNASSIIHVDDFNSVADLVRYLKYLKSNRKAYLKHFEWKRYPFDPRFEALNEMVKLHPLCRLAMWAAGRPYPWSKQPRRDLLSITDDNWPEDKDATEDDVTVWWN